MVWGMVDGMGEHSSLVGMGWREVDGWMDGWVGSGEK